MSFIHRASNSHHRRLLSQGTPYLYSDGVNDNVNFGSGATIDDLFLADCTIELWYYSDISSLRRLLSKYTTAPVGWELRDSSKNMRITVAFDVTSINFSSTVSHILYHWSHVAVTFNAATKTATIWVDGQSGGSAAGVGNYISDAALNLHTAYGGALNRWQGGIGWLRLSDVIRYAAPFSPPQRALPPAIDGNTIEQWNIDEGSGSTAAANVTTPGNDATITGATWMEG